MASLKVDNIRVAGISACVPHTVVENRESKIFRDYEAARNFINTTGVERRRSAPDGVCTSDLCHKAAEELINGLGWQKSEIDCLVFVSQTPDYALPATSPVLQDRLGLGRDCFTLDISLGCSGWVYALSVISSLMSSGYMKKGLLLAGDTILQRCSPEDQSTYPLFGDAGTATAIEFKDGAPAMFFELNSDGAGADVIVIRDGGSRNPATPESFTGHRAGDNIVRNNLQLELDGMSVFSFGISKAPKSVKSLLEFCGKDKDGVDYYIFHQANMMMNEKIRVKLALPEEKVPYSIRDFGNTSSATIPLTMVTQMRDLLMNKSLSHIGCGFGVGLSWGSVYFTTDRICCPELVEL